MKSPAFSSFRDLMDKWDESKGSLQIKSLIEMNKLVLFFKKDGKIYGAPESSRLIFAKMKQPDEDVTDGWLDEADFMAYDLGEAIKGKKVQSVFSHKNLDSIKIIDQDKVEKLLSKKGGSEVADLEDTEDNPTSPDACPNVSRLGEKE